MVWYLEDVGGSGPHEGSGVLLLALPRPGALGGVGGKTLALALLPVCGGEEDLRPLPLPNG